MASIAYFELHKTGPNENDYYVEYISDGITLMKKDFNTFKSKVLETAWTDEKISDFCQFKIFEVATEQDTESDSEYKTYNTILWVICSIFFASTWVFFGLFIYYFKKNKRLSLQESLLNNSSHNTKELDIIRTD